ncbi:hypothetical protein [Streptomyces sp. KL116D]|uniref:hypothetical protein n=1 Tax=Streptomyces sp. KL116D TaxID=3045152 RepID=UPI0035581C39
MGDGRGADVRVTSIHKMGSGLEQGSVFHLRGDLIDPATSPPAPTCSAPPARPSSSHAGLDGWRRRCGCTGVNSWVRRWSWPARHGRRSSGVPGLHAARPRRLTGPGLADRPGRCPC